MDIPIYEFWYKAVHNSAHPAADRLIIINEEGFEETILLTKLDTGGVCEPIVGRSIVQVIGATQCKDPVFLHNYNDNTDPVDPPVGQITFTPKTIAFVHNQNEILPTKEVTFGGDNWKIIGKPNFIFASDTAGVSVTNASGIYTASGSGNAVVKISLSNYYNFTQNFAPSDLAGNFTVQKNGVDEGNVAFTVLVNKISDFLVIPHVMPELAWTLDNKYYEVFSDATDTYFQLDTTIKYYDFFTNQLHIERVPQKLVLFKGRSKINLGRLIHKIMDRFPSVNENSYQYKKAEIEIYCAEKKQFDDSVVRAAVASNIGYVAGLSMGNTSGGILDINSQMNRVTANSYTYINMLMPKAAYQLQVFKNNALLETKELPLTNGNVILEKYSFQAFNQGDVATIKLVEKVSQNVVDKKEYAVFPNGYNSHHIVWENEFLLQSVFECTGEASIKTEFEFQSQKVYNNFVEKLNYLSSSKEVRFTINTGWVMQTDVDTIESLLRSKRAWIILNDVPVEIRVVPKPMVNYDTQRELIEYTIECIINRQSDEETYSL